jgi:hypothetical protein
MSAERAPLKDTSRLFVNTPRAKGTAQGALKDKHLLQVQIQLNNNNNNNSSSSNENVTKDKATPSPLLLSQEQRDALVSDGDVNCNGLHAENNCTAPIHPHKRVVVTTDDSGKQHVIPFAPSAAYFKSMPSELACLVYAYPPGVALEDAAVVQHFFQKPRTHTQKLSSGDKFPCLIGASTPKKDGYLPSLLKPGPLVVPAMATSITGSKVAPNVAHPLATAGTSASHKTATTPSVTTTATATATTTTATTKTAAVSNRKMTGEELIRWKENWRDILTRSYIFIEDYNSSNREQKKAIAAFKRLGSAIEKTFSDRTTIVISKRAYDKNKLYPATDCFRNLARRPHVKIWNYPKVTRFLNHLSEPIPATDELSPTSSTSLTNNNINNNKVINDTNNNLNDLLMNERLFGPSDRDPSVKRNDFKYFTNYYVYVYDLTQKTRPVAIREWKDKTSIPKINYTTNGKSVFLVENKPTNPIAILKRHQRRIQFLIDSYPHRQHLIEGSYKAACSSTELDLEFFSNPNFNQRCSLREMFEAEYYKPGSGNIPPVRAWEDLYNQLSEEEKEPFRYLFESNAHKHIGAPLNHSRRAYDQLNDDTSILEVSCPPSKRQKLPNQGLAKVVEISTTNDGQQKHAHNIVNVHEEEDEDDAEDDEDNLQNLISDKSDAIDQMNNPFHKHLTALNTQLPNKGDANGGDKSGYKSSHIMRPTMDFPTLPPLVRNDTRMEAVSQQTNDGKSLLREYGEIVASGIQASGVNPSGNACSHGNSVNFGNGLGPSKSQVISKRLVNEHKRIVVLTPNLPSAKTKTHPVIEEDAEIPAEFEKASTSKNSINEDELAALRSVEAANPFISDGHLKNHGGVQAKKLKIKAKRIFSPATNLSQQRKNTLSKNEVKEMQKEKEIEKEKEKDKVTDKEKEKKEEKMEDKAKRESKPGYCENCRVKYSDFHSHVLSEKHRSFALNKENFALIDDLIAYFSEREGGKNDANTCSDYSRLQLDATYH